MPARPGVRPYQSPETPAREGVAPDGEGYTPTEDIIVRLTQAMRVAIATGAAVPLVALAVVVEKLGAPLVVTTALGLAALVASVAGGIAADRREARR